MAFSTRLVTILVFLFGFVSSVQAEQLPWEDGGDRSYIPDSQPETITPDAVPDYEAPPADNIAPPRRYTPRGRNENITDREYSSNEISDAGHQFFGSVSVNMAKVIEHAFKNKGRPNGYILGEEASGAIIAGLRYGEGTLFTKDAGTHKVYWQGPSVGYDLGASGSKTMILVYNLYSPDDIYRTFGGVAGSAYFIGGVGMTLLKRDHVTLAPIRSGIGFRVGANIGYLKYTRRPTWNPF